MTTFSDLFSQRVIDLEVRAKSAGSNLTQLCKKTGVARATVERWRFRPPQTVSKLDELEAEVQRLESLKAAASA